MKNILFIFISIITFSKTNAQVVFCPSGAEWHYRFFNLPTWGGIKYYQNESIKYVRDSVISLDTVKIVSHTAFYVECNHQNEIAITLIKQKGDTVFFKNNKTQNTWQILYNYACTPGNGWQTTILSGLNSAHTYSYIVSAVSYTNINGYNLKVLDLGGYYVTERFGRNDFLFYYSSNRNCDGYYLYDALCYSDSVFGVKKFTDKDCYFAGIDGIKEYVENDILKIFPNPAKDFVSIKINTATDKKFKIKISDITGKELEVFQLEQGDDFNLSVSLYKAGVYFANIVYEEKTVATKKLVVVK